MSCCKMSEDYSIIFCMDNTGSTFKLGKILLKSILTYTDCDDIHIMSQSKQKTPNISHPQVTIHTRRNPLPYDRVNCKIPAFTLSGLGRKAIFLDTDTLVLGELSSLFENTNSDVIINAGPASKTFEDMIRKVWSKCGIETEKAISTCSGFIATATKKGYKISEMWKKAIRQAIKVWGRSHRSFDRHFLPLAIEMAGLNWEPVPFPYYVHLPPESLLKPENFDFRNPLMPKDSRVLHHHDRLKKAAQCGKILKKKLEGINYL